MLSLQRAATFVLLATASMPTPLRAESAEEHFRAGLEWFEKAGAKWETSRADAVRFCRRAGESFAAAWRAGAQSTEVLTNAANCFAFADAKGEAVLFYRRALAVDPGNEAARRGLEHTRSDLPIREKANTAASLSDSLFFWHRERNFHLRFWLFCALFPLAWILFGLELFVRKRSAWNGPFAAVGYASLLISLACFASLFYERATKNPENSAVLLESVEGRTGPGEQYKSSHTRKGSVDRALVLTPGTELEVLETSGAAEERWVHARLLDGSETWVPETSLERIILEPERVR